MSQATFRFPRVHSQEQVRVTSDSGGATVVARLRADLRGQLQNLVGPDGVTTLYLQSESGTAAVTGTVPVDAAPVGQAAVDTAVAALVTGAPAALDTLDELAAALGDDANFAATITTALAARLTTVSHGSTAGTARPTSTLPVLWIGTVAPTNRATRDLWMDETAVALKRWDGATWAASGGSSVAVVNHGSTASTARAAGAAVVEWFGTVYPTNATTGDFYTNTTTGVRERYNGTTWKATALSAKALTATMVGNSCYSRMKNTPILDLSGSGISVRDPALYYEKGTVYCFYSRVTGAGYGTTTTWKIGMASGPDLLHLTDQGVALDTTAQSNMVAASCPSGGGPSIVGPDEAGDGFYHLYTGGVNNWSSITSAGIFHFKSSSITGPWTYADTVAINGTNRPIDQSKPVYFNGQWVMLYMEYTGTGPAVTTRNMVVLTASSLNGPWTRGANLGRVGGPALTFDAPDMIVLGDRLYVIHTTDDYACHLSDITDLTTGYYLGPVLIATSVCGEVTGADFGSTSTLQLPNGEIIAAYQKGSNSYSTIMGARFGAQRLLTNWQNAGNFGGSVVSVTTSAQDLSLDEGIANGHSIPPCTYGIEAMFRVTETGTFTAGELVRIDGGFSTYSIELYPPALNVPVAVQGMIPVDPQLRKIRRQGTSTGTVQLALTIQRVHHLPL